MHKELYDKSIHLLKQLITVPSFSKEEDRTAEIIMDFLSTQKVQAERLSNNIYTKNKYYDSAKPTILLNSHHDTVKPDRGYTNDPFSAIEKNGKLFGLGSNDAGGSLVALIATFLFFYDQKDLKYNLILAASAEEEISGRNGIELLLPALGNIDFGIVGEPTEMKMAIAERGLLVIDCTAEGKAGHVAGTEGENALYKAVVDINWIKNYRFGKVSPLLGETKMQVTVIETDNRLHNVIPSQCKFVIDIRVNELYSFDEVLQVLQQNLKSGIQPRSTRLRSTSISLDHPLTKAGLGQGMEYYGSPTISDKALMPFPTLKLGPGKTARSHSADEFIYLTEIEQGIGSYITLIEKIIN